jgi:signal transduction histidine kinase
LWFKAVLAAVGLAVLWILYRFRLHQLAYEYDVRLEERVSERTRIARELHDTLLQSFQGLMLRLQAIHDLLPEGKLKVNLEESLVRADQAIEEGRSTVYELRSPVASTDELVRTLQTLGDELAVQDSADFRLIVEGPTRDLQPMIRDEIYSVAREALRNAFKHAQAHHIEAEITFRTRELRLSVRDDGTGISDEIVKGGRDGHYGLHGMRERAGRIGAALDIWSRPGVGTEIELRVAGMTAYQRTADRGFFQQFRRKAAVHDRD